MDYIGIINTITGVADQLTDINNRAQALRVQYIPIRNEYITTGRRAGEFRAISQQLQEVTSEFLTLPIPDLYFNELLQARKDYVRFRENPDRRDTIYNFMEDYNRQYGIIITAYNTLFNELLADRATVAIDFGDVLSHAQPSFNHTIIARHKLCLDQISKYNNQQCELAANNLNPNNIYATLATIAYGNTLTDYQAYIQIACAVRTILKRNRHSFLKTAIFSAIPVEDPELQFELEEHHILSDTSVEGVVWTVGYNNNATPFATMKYSKIVGPNKSYNMIHELTVGLILNFLRAYVPNFMYVWGGFSCSIPADLGPIAAAPPGAVAGVGGNATRNHDFGTMCVGNNSNNMDVIMLSENIVTFGSANQILNASVVPGNPKHVDWLDILHILFQVIVALYFAQAYCKFVHGDLHSGNVLIKRLAAPVDLAYDIDGVTYTIRTQYIAVIIDYGLARIGYPAETPAGVAFPPPNTVARDAFLPPLKYNWDGVADVYAADIPENHQYRGVFMPLYDVARFTEQFNQPGFAMLDNVLSAGLGIAGVFGLRAQFAVTHNPGVFMTPVVAPLKVMAINLYTSLMDPNGVASPANRPAGFT